MVTSINMKQNKEMISISVDFQDIKTHADIDEMSKVLKLANDAALVAIKDIVPEDGKKGRTLANRLIG